jgi:hypothetical protein
VSLLVVGQRLHRVAQLQVALQVQHDVQLRVAAHSEAAPASAQHEHRMIYVCSARAVTCKNQVALQVQRDLQLQQTQDNICLSAIADCDISARAVSNKLNRRPSKPSIKSSGSTAGDTT